MVKLILFSFSVLIMVSLGQIYLPSKTKTEIYKATRATAKVVGHHVNNGYQIVKNTLKE
ncbi:MAG: hypothetical protein ACO20H_02375 [Bacteriovoracaceae bacterium]